MKAQTETMMRNKIFEFLEILGDTYERGLPLSGRVNNKPASKVVDDMLVYCDADDFKIRKENPLDFSVMSLGLYLTALHGMVMFNKTIPFSEIEIIKINRNN